MASSKKIRKIVERSKKKQVEKDKRRNIQRQAEYRKAKSKQFKAEIKSALGFDKIKIKGIREEIVKKGEWLDEFDFYIPPPATGLNKLASNNPCNEIFLHGPRRSAQLIVDYEEVK